MKNECRYLYLVAVLLLVLAPGLAFAAKYECSYKIELFTSSPANNSTAHLVQLYGLVGTCPNICTVSGYARAYIEFPDKDLYAHALAASMKGGVYVVQFETAATSKGSGYHGTVPCRVEGLRVCLTGQGTPC